MTFILKQLGKDQFLSPAIPTTAIEKLSNYMTTHFSADPCLDDKPTCVICFDMSGSGKTTTIMEASKCSNSIRAPISLIDNELLLNSCKNMASIQNPPLGPEDFIFYNTVETYFEKRFQIVLAKLFKSIMEQLSTLNSSNIESGANINITIPKYISPTNVAFPDLDKSLSETYKELVGKIRELKHLLVIHFDDCQVITDLTLGVLLWFDKKCQTTG